MSGRFGMVGWLVVLSLALSSGWARSDGLSEWIQQALALTPEEPQPADEAAGAPSLQGLILDVRFVGSIFASAHLAQQVQAPTAGSTYNPKLAEAVVEKLIRYYRDFGYRDVRVSLETCFSRRWQPGAGEITLIYHINEGPRYRAPTKEKPPARIGQIVLVGNRKISTESILAHVPLFPGQVLSYPDLQQAEKNLARLGLFVVDPQAGIRPTVKVFDPESDSAFKDILIEVQEKPLKD